jgi:hypothetical protein
MTARRPGIGDPTLAGPGPVRPMHTGLFPAAGTRDAFPGPDGVPAPVDPRPGGPGFTAHAFSVSGVGVLPCAAGEAGPQVRPLPYGAGSAPDTERLEGAIST